MICNFDNKIFGLNETITQLDERITLIQTEVKKLDDNNIESKENWLNLNSNFKIQKQTILSIKKSLSQFESDLKLDSTKSKIILNNQFYDRFRGSIDDSYAFYNERFNFILPKIKPVFSNNIKLLDLGCGRGEWLSIAKENGIEGLGIDHDDKIQRNPSILKNLIIGDVNEVIESFNKESFNFVSMIHFLEHQTINYICDLLNNLGKLLSVDSLLYIEVPNVHNPFISSSNFYIDPTHRTKLPVELLEHLLEIYDFKIIDESFHTINSTHKSLLSPLTKPDSRFYSHDLVILAQRV